MQTRSIIASGLPRLAAVRMRLRALSAAVWLIATANCCAQESPLAAKLVAGSPWTVSATIPGFTPFTWTFRLSAESVLERRSGGEWRVQEVRPDHSLQIEGRDGNVYTIRLTEGGTLSLDRTNLRRFAQVRMDPGAQ